MRFLKKITLILSLLPLFVLGQDDVQAPYLGGKTNARFVIKTNGGIPKPITSQMFRKSFNGFCDAGVSFNIRAKGNFYFGVGYQYEFFKCNSYLRMKVSPNPTVTLPYDTRILADCPFITVSFDKFRKEFSYVTYSLDYGYMIARYTSVIDDTSAANKPFGPKGFNAQYIKPEVAINFIDRDNPWVSFAVKLSYTTLVYKYDPKAPRLNQFGDLAAFSNRYYISWFTIGFNLNFLIGKSRE